MSGIGLAEPARAGRTGRLGVLIEPRWRRVIGVLALVLLYSGAAQIGYALQFSGPVAAVVWLPVGVGIAFLYVGGLQYWPGVVIGDLLANQYGALPLGTALAQTGGNLLEVIVATLLLRRLVPRGDPLASPTGVGRMFVAIGAGTLVSAMIGTLASLAGGVIERPSSRGSGAPGGSGTTAARCSCCRSRSPGRRRCAAGRGRRCWRPGGADRGRRPEQPRVPHAASRSPTSCSRR